MACDSIWSYSLHKQYALEDFQIFDRWISNYVGNWTSCDTLCNHSLGEFIERYPQFTVELKDWTASDNRWKKRASAVTFIIPARKGLFLPEILEIAEKPLADPDDLVQKGYGWMLKAARARLTPQRCSIISCPEKLQCPVRPSAMPLKRCPRIGALKP